MSVFASPTLIESTPVLVAEESSYRTLRSSDDLLRRSRTKMALVAIATISAIAFVIWIISKHIIIQIPWRSGLIQIGNARPLREQPNTFWRIGSGSPTPVHYEGGDNRSLFHFSTNNLAKAAHERRVVMTRNGMIEKAAASAAAAPSNVATATATSPAAHVPATTPAAAAATAAAASSAATKATAKPGACETYAAEYIQHQMGILQGTIVPSTEVNNALKAKLAACVKGTKIV